MLILQIFDIEVDLSIFGRVLNFIVIDFFNSVKENLSYPILFEDVDILVGLFKNVFLFNCSVSVWVEALCQSSDPSKGQLEKCLDSIRIATVSFYCLSASVGSFNQYPKFYGRPYTFGQQYDFGSKQKMCLQLISDLTPPNGESFYLSSLGYWKETMW